MSPKLKDISVCGTKKIVQQNIHVIQVGINMNEEDKNRLINFGPLLTVSVIMLLILFLGEY